MPVIYTITNNITKKYFIGKSKYNDIQIIKKLWQTMNRKYNRPIDVDIKKYGFKNFSFKIVEFVNENPKTRLSEIILESRNKKENLYNLHWKKGKNND